MSTFSPSDNSSFDVGHARIAIVVARWNAKITENLLIGARHGLTDYGSSCLSKISPEIYL